MNEQDFDYHVEKTFAELKKSSQVSLSMVLLGAICLIGSLVYSATRLAPLEQEIQQKTERLDELAKTEQAFQQRIAQAKAEYASLKQNIEDLYAVKVTKENRVFEVKATAKATGEKIGDKPAYNFAVYINAPEATLNQIKKVTYVFNHPTFQHPERIATDPANRFEIRYYGWGCLNKVEVKLWLKSGEQKEMNFNMCKSLGAGWW